MSVEPVSLSGREAPKLYQDTSALKKNYLRSKKDNVCNLFDGVYYHIAHHPATKEKVKNFHRLHPIRAQSDGNFSQLYNAAFHFQSINNASS